MSPGSKCQSVRFGSLTLRKTFSRDFGVKCNFSKTQIEHVMLKFLATTENIRIKRSEESNYNREKLVKNSSGKIAIRNFRYINRTRVELSYSWQETKNNRERKESEIQVDQKQASVERWTTDVFHWSTPKTYFLS